MKSSDRRYPRQPVRPRHPAPRLRRARRGRHGLHALRRARRAARAGARAGPRAGPTGNVNGGWVGWVPRAVAATIRQGAWPPGRDALAATAARTHLLASRSSRRSAARLDDRPPADDHVTVHSRHAICPARAVEGLPSYTARRVAGRDRPRRHRPRAVAQPHRVDLVRGRCSRGPRTRTRVRAAPRARRLSRVFVPRRGEHVERLAGRDAEPLRWPTVKPGWPRWRPTRGRRGRRSRPGARARRRGARGTRRGRCRRGSRGPASRPWRRPAAPPRRPARAPRGFSGRRAGSACARARRASAASM